MQAIIHYYNNQILIQDIVNLSVAEKQGLVLEFRQENAVDYYAEKCKKAKIPIILRGGKMISIDTTGFTAFNDGVGA